MKIEHNDLIYGGWPVREALEQSSVKRIFLARGIKSEHVEAIIALARQKHVTIVWLDRKKIEHLARGNNQGIVAEVPPHRLTDFDDVLDKVAAVKRQGPSLLFLDGIVDPQNLGSIIRSAVFFGVPAVVIPKWRAASLSGAVLRASAGASAHLDITQVSNLASAIESAKEKGLWIVGADMKGADAKTMDIPRPFALVMGSEGEGLHRLVEQKCDMLVSLKRQSSGSGVDSLNVGSACAALLYCLS